MPVPEFVPRNLSSSLTYYISRSSIHWNAGYIPSIAASFSISAHSNRFLTLQNLVEPLQPRQPLQAPSGTVESFDIRNVFSTSSTRLPLLVRSRPRCSTPLGSPPSAPILQQTFDPHRPYSHHGSAAGTENVRCDLTIQRHQKSENGYQISPRNRSSLTPAAVGLWHLTEDVQITDSPYLTIQPQQNFSYNRLYSKRQHFASWWNNVKRWLPWSDKEMFF